MKHRRIENVMTREPVCVSSTASFKEVAETLAEHRISGVPVVDADRKVVGVVSETDLTTRQAALAVGTVHEKRRVRLPFAAGRNARRTAVKATAANAGGLMTAPAVTIGTDASVTEAARSMAEHRVDRLPVVDDGRLVGIVTRSDLLKVFLRPDADIRAEVVDGVLVRGLWLRPTDVQVTVHQGVVTLSGRLEYRGDAEIARHMASHVDGVVKVVDQLTWHVDNAGPGPVPVRAD